MSQFWSDPNAIRPYEPPPPGHVAGSKLEIALRAGRFAVTAEMNPPDSADPADVFEAAKPLADVAWIGMGLMHHDQDRLPVGREWRADVAGRCNVQFVDISRGVEHCAFSAPSVRAASRQAARPGGVAGCA